MKNHNLLFQALEFANWAHRNKKRKLSDSPYIIHPFHVMFLLTSHGLYIDDDEAFIALIAAVLHDTLEDNPEEVSFELITKEFGAGIAEVVKGVTLDAANPNKYLSRQKILRSHWTVQVVKVADVLSNTMSLIEGIQRYGLKAVQKRFKSPLPERIAMEREFLLGFQNPIGPLLSLRNHAIAQLDDLEMLFVAESGTQ